MIIAIVIILIILIIPLLSEIVAKCEKRIRDGKYEGMALSHSIPTILIIAGTHGNEPAGSIALQEMQDELANIKDAKIITIPKVNPYGLEHNIRENESGIDLNREFNKRNPPEIVKYIKSIPADYTIDLHEGVGYYNKNRALLERIFTGRTQSTIGSTIYYTKDRDIANHAAKKLNFGLLPPSDVVDGTFCAWRKANNKSHFLVETTGQNNAQPLQKRVDQHKTAIRGLISGILAEAKNK
jgi:hypothetical protein